MLYMEEKAQVVILAGGFGTRMSSLFPDTPKVLVPVAGTPILEHNVVECHKYGYTQILIVLHFCAEKIIDYFGDGSRFGVNISYHIEAAPLGTGGALLAVKDRLSPTFLVLYADVFSDINLTRFSGFHLDNKGDISIVVHPNSHPHDSDLVIMDDCNRVVSFSAHPHQEFEELKNIVNAAMYLFNKEALEGYVSSQEKFDIAQDIFPSLISTGSVIYGYRTVEYLKDMGTPERLKVVENDIVMGVCEARSDRVKRRAIFLDRDGTLNVECGYIAASDKLELISQSGEAVKIINKSRYLAVCVTNQPVIARGECGYKELDAIHGRLDELLGLDGAYLDSLYFCPHHPDMGYEGEIHELKVDCPCRKPKPGMLLKAMSDHNIDLVNSWIIGDRTADLVAGQNVGAFRALVLTGDAGSDGKYPSRPDVISINLFHAVNFIVNSFDAYRTFIDNLLTNIGDSRYIFIGGLSMSGKSTLASLIKHYIVKQGKKAHVVDLGHFFSEDNLGNKLISESSHTKKLSAMFSCLQKGESYFYQDVGFDRITNQVMDFGESDICIDDVVIVDGSNSLKFFDQNDFPGVRIFVKSSVDCRYRRFFDKYGLSEFSSREIKDIWTHITNTEDVFSVEDVSNANYVFDNSTF